MKLGARSIFIPFSTCDMRGVGVWDRRFQIFGVRCENSIIKIPVLYLTDEDSPHLRSIVTTPGLQEGHQPMFDPLPMRESSSNHASSSSVGASSPTTRR